MLIGRTDTEFWLGAPDGEETAAGIEGAADDGANPRLKDAELLRPSATSNNFPPKTRPSPIGLLAAFLTRRQLEPLGILHQQLVLSDLGLHALGQGRVASLRLNRQPLLGEHVNATCPERSLERDLGLCPRVPSPIGSLAAFPAARRLISQNLRYGFCGNIETRPT